VETPQAAATNPIPTAIAAPIAAFAIAVAAAVVTTPTTQHQSARERRVSLTVANVQQIECRRACHDITIRSSFSTYNRRRCPHRTRDVAHCGVRPTPSGGRA